MRDKSRNIVNTFCGIFPICSNHDKEDIKSDFSFREMNHRTVLIKARRTMNSYVVFS